MVRNKILLFIGSLLFVSCGGGGSSTYTISGKVTGLFDGTLTIQNNGKDDLTVEKDGTFTFATKLANKEKFDVQVYQEPCPQRCEVRTGSGTIDGKNIDNVEITCGAKTWSETKDFLEGTEFENSSVQVDMHMNRKGNMIASWTVEGDLYLSEYYNGEWHHPSKGESIGIAGQTVLRRAVAMNDFGDAILTWVQLNIDGKPSIYKSERKLGIWTKPELLSDSMNSLDSTAYELAAAISNNGDIVIVWTNYPEYFETGSKPGVYLAELRNGIWKYPRSVEDKINFGSGQPYGPQLVINNDGNTIIGWRQTDGVGEQNLYMSEYINGTWRNPVSINDRLNKSANSVATFDLKLNNFGYGIFFWQEYIDENYNSDLHVSERLNGLWKTTNGDLIFPSGAISLSPTVISDNGDAIIGWNLFDSSEKYTNYKSERRNNNWNWPVALDASFLEKVGMSSLKYGMDEYGNASILWTEIDESEWKTYEKQFRLNHWTDPKFVSATPQVYANAPHPRAPMLEMSECRQIQLWPSDGDTLYWHYRIFS